MNPAFHVFAILLFFPSRILRRTDRRAGNFSHRLEIFPLHGVLRPGQELAQKIFFFQSVLDLFQPFQALAGAKIADGEPRRGKEHEK